MAWPERNHSLEDMRRSTKQRTEVTVRSVRDGEALQLRALRLRALADSPDAFEITLEQEEQAPAEHWIEWARRGASGEMTCTFVAEDDESLCGMAGGFLKHEGTCLVANVFGVWVDPGKRRGGVGARLVEAVLGWAHFRGAQDIQLWLTTDNARARALYARLGFVATGPTRPLPSNMLVNEELMTLRLASLVS